jgi:hypothetical protein
MALNEELSVITLRRLVVPAAKMLNVSTDVPVALVPATDAEMVLLAYSMSRVAPLAQGNPGSTSPPSHRVRLSVIESPLTLPVYVQVPVVGSPMVAESDDPVWTMLRGPLSVAPTAP